MSTPGVPTITLEFRSNALTTGFPIVFPRRVASLCGSNGTRACALLRRERTGTRTFYAVNDTPSIRGGSVGHDLGDGVGLAGAFGRGRGGSAFGNERFTNAATSVAIFGLSAAAWSAETFFAVTAASSRASAAFVVASSAPGAFLPG